MDCRHGSHSVCQIEWPFVCVTDVAPMTTFGTIRPLCPALDGLGDAAFGIDDLINGSIHVWRIDVDAVAMELADLYQMLSEDERARASRMTSRNDVQFRFIAARGMLRVLLGRYLGTAAASIAFELGPHGKPRLAGTRPDRGLVFNASNTRNHLAVAFAYEGRLGVDIECWRPIDDAAGLLSRCFAESERNYWNSLPEPRKEQELFRFWTLKEAFCKAVGRGLGLGLDHCVFDCTGDAPRLIAYPSAGDGADDRVGWHFAELGGLAGISGAVAFDRVIPSLRLCDFPGPSVGT